MRLYYDSTPTADNPTWTRVSAIVEFPDIASRNNMHGLCTVVLRDFEGVLYAAWNSRDLTRMKVTDDAGTPNTLFRGFLINKKFHDRDLVLEIAGIGIRLKRRSFGANESENYILASGIVKTLDANSRIHLQYVDPDNPDSFLDFSWWPTQWISYGKDVGLMIKDTTSGFNTVNWDAADPLVLTGDTGNATEVGDYADTHSLDLDNYNCRIDGATAWEDLDVIVVPTMDGTVVDDAHSLKSIEINWNFKLSMYVHLYLTYENLLSVVQIQIKKDTTWENVEGAMLSLNKTAGTYSTGWIDGNYIIEGTDAELQKYFNTDGAGDYDELKGFRIKFNNKFKTSASPSASYAKLYIDYLKVTVESHAYDVNPIMYKITDNGASWVECSEVSNWQQMGVTEDADAFQIGENTRKIVYDIERYAGITIDLPPMGSSYTLRPTGNDVIDWQNDEFTHVDEEIPDADAALAENAESGDITSWTFDDDVVLAEHEFIKSIVVYTYCKLAGPSAGTAVDIYYNGGWIQSKAISLDTNYDWYTTTYTTSELSGGLVDPDDLKVQHSAFTENINDKIYVDTCYVIITTAFNYTFEKYMARKFKGQHCVNVLKSVLKLEGAEWFEDNINNKITLRKKAGFLDSGISLTQANYDHDWEYEDQCNQVKYVYVWGKSSFDSAAKTTTNIFAKAVDTSVTGEKSMQIIDDNIFTKPEAQEIADSQLALLKDKRPSIRIPLNGVNIDLQLGTNVNVTMARPTVGPTDYPIRMIQRNRFGKTGIQTIIYCGFGETEWDEKIIKAINDATDMSHKSLSDRLTSTPYDIGVGGVGWGDIEGATAAVNALIATYGSTQHTRTIAPSNIGPEQGVTAGANNVYWLAGYVFFGASSKTANNYLSCKFLLPTDYVDNSDCILKLSYRSPTAGDTTDYLITAYRVVDSETIVTEDTVDSTWTTEGANEYNVNEVTLNLPTSVAGDTLDIYIRMEDDNNAQTLLFHTIGLKIQVNGRD